MLEAGGRYPTAGTDRPFLAAITNFQIEGGVTFAIDSALSLTDGAEAVLVRTFRTGNPTDLSVNSAVNLFDVLNFLELFDASDVSTNLNGSGSLNTDDVELMIRITRGWSSELRWPYDRRPRPKPHQPR